MSPLTEREIRRTTSAPSLLDHLTTSWLDGLPARSTGTSIDDYVALALRGSFPDLALADRSERQRGLWLSSYIDDLVTRDVSSIGNARDPERLRRYLTALSINLAGLPSDSALTRDAGINARTAAAYDGALTSLGILDVVPAWTSNRLKRLTRTAKRYVVDTALAASSAGVGERDVMGDADLRGRWFDAFATMQIRAELESAATGRSMYHLRHDGGRHEVDLILDLGAGRVFGIEFKAGTAPNAKDARHLTWLRDELGAKFVGGVVFHSGSSVIELDERIAAIPLSMMWSPPARVT